MHCLWFRHSKQLQTLYTFAKQAMHGFLCTQRPLMDTQKNMCALTSAKKFTLSHTFAEPGCTDILITYGNLYPYCGEYYRHIVTVLN